jgi:hypothetical protein
MRNLALAVISTGVVAVGLSSTPASAFTFMQNPPPDYALPDPRYMGGESAHAPDNYGPAPRAHLPEGGAGTPVPDGSDCRGRLDYPWSGARSCF